MSARTATIRLVCLTAMILVVISSFAAFMQGANALDGEGSVTSPIMFWAQDTNGDNLSEYLWINVSLTVTVQDAFRFDLRLNDSANATEIARAVNDTYFLPGVHSIPMMVDGYYFNSTLKRDGPFVASVKVFNEPGRVIAWASSTSPAYLASDFEHPPAAVGKPYGDSGVDLDIPPDGLFNQLHVSLPINFTEPGRYMLGVFVKNPMPPFAVIASAFLFVEAKAGDFTYDVSLSGIPIRASGVDGPYIEDSLVWALPDSGPPVQMSYSSNNSQPYLAVDFQTRPVITVTGTVTDDAGAPILGATVIFANCADLFWKQATTDFLGMYSLNLYAGDFVGIATQPGFFADNASSLRVSGAGPYDFVIHSSPANTYDIKIVMPSTDSMDWALVKSQFDGLSSTRMMIDWNFGNKDGYVSAEESSVFAGLVGQRKLTDDTDTGLHVDGIFYYPSTYANNIFDFNTTGLVLSQLPLTKTEGVHFSSNSTIPRQVSHLVRVNATYDSPGRERRITLQMPPRWIAMGYDPVANVTVSGIGTGIVTVDPLGNPNPTGIPDYVWVNITAMDTSLVPPTIQGQNASPDPQEYMRPVRVSAWINDSSPVAGASVDITAPTAGLLGNSTMSYNSTSGKYEFLLGSYPDLGTYLFMVWATDADSNVASGGGTFTVRDTTAPVADAGPDQAVAVGITVTLDGSVSADNFGVSNWTWTFDDGSGNVTLYGRVVTHDFNGVGTYIVTLAVRDASGNQGIDNLTVVVEIAGDPDSIPDIPALWSMIISVFNALSAAITAVLASFFVKWHRLFDRTPLGNIAVGFCVLAVSLTFGAAFLASPPSSPVSQTRVLLLTNLSLQTLAFSFIATGYCLWKREATAGRLRILLSSLLVLVTLTILLYSSVLSSYALPDLSTVMQFSLAVNLALLCYVTSESLRNYVRHPRVSDVAVPFAFGLLALGQYSLLIWSIDGGLTSFVLASANGLVGLILLLRVVFVQRGTL